jgi:hypothetical protein
LPNGSLQLAISSAFAAVADRLEGTIAETDPKRARALLLLLITGLRVNGTSRSADSV